MRDDAEECTSCGHRFEERSAKQTMMGLPTIGGGDDSEPEDKTRRADASKQTLWGMPALEDDDDDEVAKTEVVSADDLPFSPADFDLGDEEEEDATKEVSASSISNALGGGRRTKASDQKGSAKETAFGLPAISAEQDDSEPDEVSSAWGLADSSAAEESAEDEEPRGGQNFGTLMGMNVPETFNQDGAGAMHRGSQDEVDQYDDAVTEALGADQLAQFEDMGFGGQGEAKESAPEESDKTAVLDPKKSGFQLPKPQEAPDEGKGDDQQPTPEPTSDRSSGQGFRQRPQSGVFRSAPKKKKRAGRGDSPSGRQGVGGTGTYQMSNTDRTDTTSGRKIRDEDLSIGAVGSSRTSFPTGGQKDEQQPTAPEGGPAAKKKESETLKPASTGPRFSIGGGGAQRSRKMTPQHSSPTTDSHQTTAPSRTQQGTGQQEPVNERPRQERRGPVQGDPAGGERKKPPVGAGQPSAPTPGFSAPPVEESEPKPSFGATPAEESKPGPAFGGIPAEESKPEPAFGATPASASKAEPAFGATPVEQPGRVPGGGAQGASQHRPDPRQAPNKPAEPVKAPVASDASPSAPAAAPAAATPQRAPAGGSQEAKGADNSAGVGTMVDAIQRGFGLLGSLALMGAVAATVAFGGLPTALIDFGIMGLAVVMGVVTVPVVALVGDSTKRSVALALMAMIILVGFMAGLLMGADMMLALGLCAGALLLFCGAIFAVVGDKLMARSGA